MQERKRFIRKALIVAPLGAALLVAGCGGGGNDDDDAVSGLSGKVIQGPVSGARVFADLDGDRQLDAGEVAADAVTGTDGSFTFSTALSGDYVLVTEGGTDELTREPAYPALAPKGARNITPLTTMVAAAGTQAESVKTILNQLAGSSGYDLDLSATGGVSADVMKLAKSVESALKVFADLGVTAPSAQRAIFAETAKQLVAVKTATPTASVETLIQSAVAASAEAIATDPAKLTAETNATPVSFQVTNTSAFKTIVTEAVTAVNTAITAAAGSTGVVTETQDLQTQVTAAVRTVITDNSTTLDTIVKTVAMEVNAVRGYASGATTPLATASGTALDSLITVSSAIAALEADLALRNDFAAAKTYSPVSVSLTVTDTGSQRQATFNVTGLSVTAAATGGGISVSDSAAQLTVVGRTAAGVTVNNVQPFAGPLNGFTFSSNKVRFDLEAIQSLVAAKTELSSFADLSKAGTYSVTLAVQGAPVAGRSIQIKVQ